MDILDYVVPWVRQTEAYSESHLEYAWRHPKVLRMMSNENPLCPSDSVRKAILEAINNGNRYPDTGGRLRERLAEMNGLSRANVLLGNGSTDIIDILLRTFAEPTEEVIISVPTFSMYERRARCNGIDPVLIPMTRDFDIDIPSILAAVNDRTKFVFLCSPNNPTGQHIPTPTLRRVLDLGLPTLVDEAYYELGNDPQSVVPLLVEYPNLIISRTFSKAYGLAGLRLGYVFADSRLIECMEKIRLPWNINILTFAAAFAQLDDVDDLNQKRSLIIAGRDYIQAELSKIPGLRVYPSEGNFLLIDGSELGFSSSEIYTAMRDQYKIQLRPMQSHHGRDGLVRITIATEKENKACVEGLKELFSKGQ